MSHFLRLATSALVIVALPRLAPAQDKFFDSNGVQLRYVEAGTGEPIVLVHGFIGNVESSWVETGVLANLAKGYHVIALDNRGHGKSGKPHDPKAYGKEMSEDIVRLLDHLNIRRAHIVGYSMGARIVATLLTTHPERFLTATLGGPSVGLNWTAEDDRHLELRAAETEKGSFRSVILTTLTKGQPTPTDEEIRQTSQQASQKILDGGGDLMALAAVVRGFRNLTVTDAQMAAVRVPTLVVVGSLDPLVATANQLKSVMPSLKVVVVQGASHTGASGVPRRPEFVNAIREFIVADKNAGSR